jgi:hypothetical protein
VQRSLKKRVLDQKRCNDSDILGQDRDTNTLNIPLGDEEVLGPTPPEDHHHISKDVRYKVNVLKWLADNKNDPALTVSASFNGPI